MTTRNSKKGKVDIPQTMAQTKELLFEDKEQHSSTNASKLVKEANRTLQNPLKVKDAVKEDKQGNTNSDVPVTAEFIEGLVAPKPAVESITENQLKKLLPIKANSAIISETVGLMNEALAGVGSDLSWFLKDNLLGLLESIQGQKNSSLKDYVNASKFVTYKQMGDSDVEAYSKTFPEKVTRLEKEKKPVSFLYAYANSYAKNKLIARMQALLLVPAHVMHQDVFHLAVRTQSEIMMDDDVAPKVRSDAANSLMTHLKAPEIKQMELNVGVSQTSEIADLHKAMTDLARAQYDQIQEGRLSVVDVKQSIIYEEEEGEEDFG